MPPISRQPKDLQVKLTNSINTTPHVMYQDASDARIIIPTGYNSTTLTFYESDRPDGTYVACHTDAGTAITLTVAAGKSYNFPPALFASHHLKIVTGSDDSATAVSILKKC